MKKSTKIPELLIIAFFLNLLWEVSHSLLYEWNKLPLKNSVYDYIPTILLASIGDVFYIFIIISVIAVFHKSYSWIEKPKKIHYLSIIILGILTAIFIEVKAQILNKWEYTSLMPTIFGIGLTPLVQLAITGALALFLTKHFTFK